MSLNNKIRMASNMVKLGYISEDSYKKLLDGFKLIEQDKINNVINRAK